MPEGQPLCRDFERGTCSRGDDCKFSHSQDISSICRDYERGVCTRGENCKFAHPEDLSSSVNGKIPICKDFQSKFCNRSKCKFLHLTVEEEADYKNTGKLPEHGGHPDESSYGKSFCKDFLNGKCIRGASCKFSHSISNEYGDMYGKRSRVEYINDGPLTATDIELVKENESLLEQIEEVQKQLHSLRQTNDTLFEQNTRFRAQLHGSSNDNTNNPATTAGASLLPLNNQTNHDAYPQYNSTQPTYSQYNSTQSTYSQYNSNQPSYSQYSQTQYQQYGPPAYSQYNQSAYPQYTQPAPVYPQYNQSTTSQYSQPTYPQYSQTSYTGYWNTYPQYG